MMSFLTYNMYRLINKFFDTLTISWMLFSFSLHYWYILNSYFNDSNNIFHIPLHFHTQTNCYSKKQSNFKEQYTYKVLTILNKYKYIPPQDQPTTQSPPIIQHFRREKNVLLAFERNLLSNVHNFFLCFKQENIKWKIAQKRHFWNK